MLTLLKRVASTVCATYALTYAAIVCDSRNKKPLPQRLSLTKEDTRELKLLSALGAAIGLTSYLLEAVVCRALDRLGQTSQES